MRRISQLGLIASFIILLGVVFQTAPLMKTGMEYSLGVGYWGPLARDGVWHEALVGMLSKGVPPILPGFALYELSNYHYFYDLLVLVTHQLSGVGVKNLIYIVYPIIFSTLLGVGVYRLTWKLWKSKLTTILSLFFVYFGSSFGWVVEFVKRGSLWGGESAFWANQPVSMNLNPPFAISLVIIVFLLILLIDFTKPSWVKFFTVALLGGSLFGFKSYAGVLFLGILAILVLKKYIFDRDNKYFAVFCLTLFFSFMVFLVTARGSASFIEIQPLWLVDTMIDAGDRVGIPDFTSRRSTYLSAHRWHLYVPLQILCISIFIVGNFGTRILGLFLNYKKAYKHDIVFAIAVGTILSIAPTLVFVQKGNPWNIVQFMYYGLFFASLLAAKAMSDIYSRLGNKLGTVFIAIIVFVTPVSSLAAFSGWLYPTPPAYVSTKELEALSHLSKEVDGTVLKYPFRRELRDNYQDPYPIFAYADNNYVSAYSRKAVYMEDEEQLLILGVDYQDRKEKALMFFETRDLAWSRDFLKQNIDYIYLPKVYSLPASEQEYPIEKIFENDEVNVYRVLE